MKKNKYIPETLRIRNKKFVDYYNTLINIKMSGAKSELKEIKKNISGEERLFFKDWLLEKIKEI
ncbi:MAG: hypothetical protein M3R36_04880 [Bacteroidota bacterium]|nr:hypothetical protein [Bacteroidota bacterium]